jgi:hypothetical protein
MTTLGHRTLAACKGFHRPVTRLLGSNVGSLAMLLAIRRATRQLSARIR